MDHHKILKPHLVKMCNLLDCEAAPVHERQGFYKKDALGAEGPSPILSRQTFMADRDTVFFGEPVNYLKPDIVPAPLVGLSGVS